MRIAAVSTAPLPIAAPVALADLGTGLPEPGLAPVNFEPVLRKVPLDAAQSLAEARDERAFVPQISDTARAAYIAQVGFEGSEPRLAVRTGGEVLGAVEFQVAGGRVSVHIGQVLDLFEAQMGSERFAELRGSAAAQGFVSLDRLQGAGIPLEYDAVYDELVLQPSSG